MPLPRDILPAWFTDRLLHDEWPFGLLLSDGTVVGVQSIKDVKQGTDGTVWLDVRLIKKTSGYAALLDKFEKKLLAPTSRLQASINASHVMAAFELADT